MKKDLDAEVAHQEHLNEKWATVAEAQTAFTVEREEGFLRALRDNKRAVLWSLLISTAIIMEGYDTSLLPQFYGYPSFQKHYGQYFPNLDSYQVTGPWQAGLSNGANVGVIFGGFLNGWAVNRFGYKRTMIVAMTFIAGALFVVFFSPNVKVLLAGEILCGIPWGVFATTGPAYASEVCPLALRGYLTVYCNLCWACGQLIANGVLQGLVDNTTQWSYRIPWAIQWIWPAILLVGCIFAPESPWWLIKNDRIAEAEEMLARLTDHDSQQLKATIAQMIHTIEIEKEMLSGAQFAYGPSYFFLQAGMSTNDAYKVAVGSTALAFLGTVLSWLLLTYFGRRTIFLSGIAALTTVLMMIGIISVTTDNDGGLWAQASLCLIWQLIYSLSVGPICYAIISETSAIRLRAKTVVLARNTYNVTTVWAAVMEPYMMNPTEWNWKGKTAFFWCGTGALMTAWVFFRLPECKGRTYEELDLLFARKVPTRKFKKAVVDPYAAEDEQVKVE